MISPLLANIYLHYAFDLWVEVWRKKCAHGDMIVVRYADDLVSGFQHRTEADRFLRDFRERLRKFGLELNPDKTRRIEFGRYAEQHREREGKVSRNRSTFWDLVCCRSTRIGRSHDLINSWTSCAIDEGGPLEIGFQEQVTNHLQAATVKSRGGERWRKSARKTCAGAHPRDERK